MCLILFAVEPNPDYRLIVAANRDEFYSRSAEPAHCWPDQPSLLAGRDKEMGGTWLGINQNGRFAAVTNFKEEPPHSLTARSRGELPLQFLTSNQDPKTYSEGVSRRAKDYRGFNLIAANHNSVAYYSNRQDRPKILEPGYYGLSNQILDCDWPKVAEGRMLLKQSIKQEDSKLVANLFEILSSRGDDREFSSSFIQGNEYGTRSSTVVVIKHNGEIFFEEKTFGTGGISLNDANFLISYNVGS